MKAILLRASLALAVLVGISVVTVGTSSAAPEDQVAVTECVQNFYLGQTCATEYVGYPAAVPYAFSYAAYPTYYGATYPYTAGYGYRPYGGYSNYNYGGHRHHRYR